MLRKAEERDTLLYIRAKIDAYDAQAEIEAHAGQDLQGKPQRVLERIELGGKGSPQPLQSFATEMRAMLFFSNFRDALQTFLSVRLSQRYRDFGNFPSLRVSYLIKWLRMLTSYQLL